MNKIILILFFTFNVSAQGLLPPVNLPISNIPQQTQVWCWAAVAQQIILAKKGPTQTPPQCALVAMAHNQHPNFCCTGSGNPACVKTGSLQQIQYLIGQFGGAYSSLAPPTDYMTLYNTLASGKAIILQVRSGQMSAHVIVLTGIYFIQNQSGFIVPMLNINDPLSYYGQTIPYQTLIQSWMSAIVVN